ncbi:MAG: hypothetical protein ACXIUW_16455 [Roseinatronobacter sp.]
MARPMFQIVSEIAEDAGKLAMSHFGKAPEISEVASTGRKLRATDYPRSALHTREKVHWFPWGRLIYISRLQQIPCRASISAISVRPVADTADMTTAGNRYIAGCSAITVSVWLTEWKKLSAS